MRELSVAPHPHLHLGAVRVTLPGAVSALPSPPSLVALLRPDAVAPLLPPDDAVRAQIRDLLRQGGFKPTGRSKPSSEYLVRAATEGTLASINLVVDVGNAVSLHSGIPISVVDLERARPPLRVELAPAGATFVFNAAGQTIDVAGLLGLADAEGPCANAVKDAQRTKTGADTTHALFLLWGHRAVAARVDAAAAWCRELLAAAGAAAEG